jgi:soluble lytic murein transglycosylase-like protein
MAEKFALAYGMEPSVAVAQFHHESNYNTRARSRAGAIGVAQIMPKTAKAWGVNPWNPVAALRAATKNMAQYVKTYRSQGHDYWTAHKMALCAYNAGPGAVAKYKGCPPYRETQRYHKSILAEARRAE